MPLGKRVMPVLVEILGDEEDRDVDILREALELALTLVLPTEGNSMS